MRSLYLSLFLILSTLLSWTSHAEEEFLSPEAAFQFVELINPDEVVLQWQIADAYYLYKDRIKVLADGVELPIDSFPEAKLKYDEYFGEVGVYYHFLNIPIQVGDAKQLEVHYQGCADAGLCYPPQTSTVLLNADMPSQSISEPSSTAGSAGFDIEASDFELLQRLQSGSTASILALFFLVGIVTAFAGCSYPMFPILSKIIVGEGEKITRARAFSLSLAYVLPIAVVYAILGVIAGSFGNNLSNWFQTPAALSVVALILVAMALSMLGLYELQIPSAIQSKLNNISNQQKSGSYIGAITMGILSAFIVSACTVPPIVAAITYIAQTGDTLLGASAMFLFGLGLGFPLLLLGLSASWLLPKAGAWMDKVQKVMGIFLLSAAIYIIGRFAAEWVSLLLWAGLLISIGAVLVVQSKSVPFKLLGGASFVLAGALLAQLSPQQAEHKDLGFSVVGSSTELDKIIAESQQPLFIDYYADWCTSCVKMEKKIYPQPAIQQLLSQFKLVKIDLTEMNAEKQALMQQHQVVGPPAMLFLNADGGEYRELRITGETDAEGFAKALEKALATN